jgi:hypothetical protein
MSKALSLDACAAKNLVPISTARSLLGAFTNSVGTTWKLQRHQQVEAKFLKGKRGRDNDHTPETQAID